MRHALIGLAGLVLAGCGSIPPTMVSGNSLSTEHSVGRFKDAAEGAQAACSSKGMVAKHVGTDNAGVFGMPISRFECVAK